MRDELYHKKEKNQENFIYLFIFVTLLHKKEVPPELFEKIMSWDSPQIFLFL